MQHTHRAPRPVNNFEERRREMNGVGVEKQEARISHMRRMSCRSTTWRIICRMIRAGYDGKRACPSIDCAAPSRALRVASVKWNLGARHWGRSVVARLLLFLYTWTLAERGRDVLLIV